ncbi:hypothetical protein RB195_024816 [Necator americanus]|uniref:Uncharacterized protein n=1 Tax=Necator americanus TaxID=51031 RepID=A0ABR1ERW0_NECAM
MYLGRSTSMGKDLKKELNKRTRPAWAAFASVSEATNQLKDQDLRPHLFDSTVLPALLRSGDVGRHRCHVKEATHYPQSP